MSDDPYGSLNDFESLLLEFCERHALEDDVAFDAFCAQRPDEADGIRSLRATWLSWDVTINTARGETSGRRSESRAPQLGEDERDELLHRLRSLWKDGELARRYELGGEIARGGVGVVLAARDLDCERDLAMKVLLAPDESSAAAFPAAREDDGERARWLTSATRRFVREALVTAQLDHPGIIPVHGVGTDGCGRPYFTMKLVKGRTLDAIIRDVFRGQDGWTINRVVGVLQRVCEAVSYAHSKLVLHCDLKPSNIMIGAFGETYVMDWGLWAPLHSDDADVLSGRKRAMSGAEALAYARSGSILGTIPYMAPEQAGASAEPLDERTDVYSIGAILYHVLTGLMPYGDGPLVPLLVLLSVRDKGPKAIRELHPNAPPALVDICERAMARDPDDRHPTVARLGEELANYLADLNDDRRRAQTVSLFLREMLSEHSPERSRGRDVTVREVVARAVEQLDHTVIENPGDEAVLRLTIGRVFRQLDRMHEAKPQIQRAMHLFEEAGMQDTREGMACRNEQAYIADRDEKLGLAIELLEELVVRQRRLLGPHDEDTLESLHMLAEALRKSALDLERAFALHREVHELRSLVLGEHDPATLDSLNCMALLLESFGHTEQAVEALEQVLAGAVAEWGEDHEQTITVRSDFATMLARLGKSEQSLMHARIAADSADRVLGERHRYSLTTWSNVGDALRRLGRLDESEEVFARTLARARANQNPPRRIMLVVRNNLAVLRVAQGRHDEALALHREVVVEAGELLTAGDSMTARFRTSYARALLAAQHLGEAEQELLAALAILESNGEGPWARDARAVLETVRRRLAERAAGAPPPEGESDAGR